MGILRKIYRITDLDYAGVILRQGINRELAIFFASIPLLSVLLLPLIPILGFRYWIYLLGILIYSVLFLPAYLMPYARCFKIDSEANKIYYLEEHFFLFFRPQKPWLELLPNPKGYARPISTVRLLKIDQYNRIKLLNSENSSMFPDLVFPDLYELTRAIVRMYRVMDAEVLVKPWEGNYGNPYPYLERKLKDAQVAFTKEKP